MEIGRMGDRYKNVVKFNVVKWRAGVVVEGGTGAGVVVEGGTGA